MLNYTDAITRLMRDITVRVEALSFIDLRQVLVFARFGRVGRDGPYATCHSLNLPPSDPGYFFWRDRATGELARRSEWFVTKSPSVEVNGAPVHYLISFALPRFCEQTLDRAHKRERYAQGEPWIAKLDTVVHELFHIDPAASGIRRLSRGDGCEAVRCHSPEFFAQVQGLVDSYLSSGPDEAVFGFLRHDFATLREMYGGVTATTFRQFPSYPQRYHEPLCTQPETPIVDVVPLSPGPRQRAFTEADLCVRVFTEHGTRRLVPELAGRKPMRRRPRLAAARR